MIGKSCSELKGTVVNQTLPYLHGGSLEITLTVPFSIWDQRKNTCHIKEMFKINIFSRKFGKYLMSVFKPESQSRVINRWIVSKYSPSRLYNQPLIILGTKIPPSSKVERETVTLSTKKIYTTSLTPSPTTSPSPSPTTSSTPSPTPSPSSSPTFSPTSSPLLLLILLLLLLPLLLLLLHHYHLLLFNYLSLASIISTSPCY